MTSAANVEALHRRLVEAGTVGAGDVRRLVAVSHPLLPERTRDELCAALTARLEGVGAVQGLLDDPAVTDVLINGPGPVHVDRGAGVEATDVEVDDEEIGLLLQRVLSPVGRRVDRSSPTVDARLPDGSRLHAVLPPLAIDGPIVTLRRFSTRPRPLADWGSEAAAVLAGLVDRRATLLVTGATGVGKTSLLGALAGRSGRHERLVTLEDPAELRIDHPQVVRLETRPATLEGSAAIGLDRLVRESLRMRPDRLVVGEVRGPEAVDLVLALATGHRGSMATVHAATAAEALRRIELLSLSGRPDLPAPLLRRLIGSAVDHLIVLERRGPTRFVREIVDVPSSGEVSELTERWTAVPTDQESMSWSA